MIKNNVRAQTFIEYTLIFAIVAGLVIGMSTYIKRSSQAMVRVMADQIGVQQGAEQLGGEFGHLADQQTITRIDRDVTETEDVGGATRTSFDRDEIRAEIETTTNMGFRRHAVQ